MDPTRAALRASKPLTAALAACLLFACATAPRTTPAAQAARPSGAPMAQPELSPTLAPLYAQATAAMREGRIADAESAERAALAAAERDFGPESIETARALAILAAMLERQRRYTEAEALHRRGLAIATSHYAAWRTSGRGAEVAADAARLGVDPYGDWLGLNLERQGRRAEAAVIWERVRAAHAADGDTGWEAPEIAAMPGFYQGAIVNAPTPAEAALAARLQSAETMIAEGRFAEAEAAARSLIAEGADPVRSFLLARALLGQGKLEAAGAQLEQVLAGLPARASLGFRVDVMLALADTDRRRGMIEPAERLYRTARGIVAGELGPLHPDTLDIDQMIAFLLGEQGRFEEAAAAYRDVCRGRVERARAFSRGTLAGSDPARIGAAADCGRRLANALRRVALVGGGPAAALRDEAFTAAQIFQQSAAGDSLARSGARTAAVQAGAGGLAVRYEERLAARAAVDDALHETRGDENAAQARRASLNAERERLDREIAPLAVELADRQRLYWDLRAPQPLTVDTLQADAGPDPALLRDDEALVLLMVPRGQIHGLVFAVSRRGAAWADIPLTGDEIEAQVRALRTQIDPMAYGLARSRAASRRAPGSGRFDRAMAYGLYRALFGDPEIQRVIADPPTLLIVPTGALTSLPPGVLVTAPPPGGAAADGSQAALRDTAWLLRSKAIALLPSVSSLRTLRQLLPTGAQPSDPLLAFTDPDFGGGMQSFLGISRSDRPRAMTAYFRAGVPLEDALRSLPRLTGTADEGLAMARALHATPGSILSRAEATKAALFARDADGRLARVRVLEFATHGLIAGDALGLFEPSLVLAAGATPEDELLTASEAARLTLHAEWVLLSACNTASPDSTRADGLSGLARAFFHAGARSLLVSHWRVNDGIAPVLVPSILDRMARDPALTRAAAVQQASLAILDDRTIAGAHPAIWAPFTLVGEAGR